jgi:hypothetical protein
MNVVYDTDVVANLEDQRLPRSIDSRPHSADDVRALGTPAWHLPSATCEANCRQLARMIDKWLLSPSSWAIRSNRHQEEHDGTGFRDGVRLQKLAARGLSVVNEFLQREIEVDKRVIDLSF